MFQIEQASPKKPWALATFNQHSDRIPMQQPVPNHSTLARHVDLPACVSLQAANDEQKWFSVPGLSFNQRLVKRAFDLASVVVILALFWWVIIGVSIAVCLTAGRPVIFGHTRIGRYGKEFKCYKFRSMVNDADAVLAELLATDPEAREQWARDFKLKNDPRVTRIGRFIRKTSFDEFPQLWNVVRGEMSVVGPRPVVRKELDAHYGGALGEYECVSPGLTGPWQVSGRNDMDYAERVEIDRCYAANWSVWSDFSIVMRTIGVMFGRRGAY